MSLIETIIDVPAEHERKVCGQFDCYLKKIERTLHVSMIARDGEIKIIGPDYAVKKAKSVFSTLIEGRMKPFWRSIRISSAAPSTGSL